MLELCALYSFRPSAYLLLNFNHLYRLPWSEFGGPYLTPLRLFGLVVTILIFRRLPAVMALYPFIPALHDKRQALFSGWFGPVGISGICSLGVLILLNL